MQQYIEDAEDTGDRNKKTAGSSAFNSIGLNEETEIVRYKKSSTLPCPIRRGQFFTTESSEPTDASFQKTVTGSRESEPAS
ncbi:hypothetical protein F2P81_021117 [Scophthalmus maximus]|uniref:Uncharacterized protein n=1 Tax=Scophthalmus maximus TaxID=52904 RepID=A0A6A4S424_SCOMX|nr:hypothetical protein F2P81_021117 [Scophthalmus maximus]